MNYRLEDMVQMVYSLGESDGNCLLASRLYEQKFPERRHPDQRAFRALKIRFEETGKVFYRKFERACPVTNDENTLNIALHITENPHVSTRILSRELEISQSSVSRMVRKCNYHPYHMQLMQELTERDFPKRMRFCQWGVDKINQEPNFFEYVLFSDEATFHNNGHVNRHNMHYYATENPHFVRYANHQQRWSLNVWGGIIGRRVIGPFFFKGHLNGRKYLRFLRSQLTNLLDDIPLAVRQRMWLQQDGAPAHYNADVREYIDNEFSEKWIGRGGPVQWPPRSPDLTKMDFFLWGYIKWVVYKTPPTTPEDMKARIRSAFRGISEDMLERVETDFRNRLRVCIGENGKHIEHLLH